METEEAVVEIQPCKRRHKWRWEYWSDGVSAKVCQNCGTIKETADEVKDDNNLPEWMW